MDNSLKQLTLGIKLKDHATFNNFYVGSNEVIVSALKNMTKGIGEKIIYLCGASGQGCSHLLQAVCHEAFKNNKRSVYLPMQEMMFPSPEIFQNLDELDIVCVDDIQFLEGKSEWEEALFHFYNRMYDNHKYLLLAAHDIPKALSFTLPDLQSRLSFGVVYQLKSLRDDEKLKALTLRALQRGITLSEEAARFILTHTPRHMKTLCAALDVLDNASLALQRKLTIPFIKDVLQI